MRTVPAACLTHPCSLTARPNTVYADGNVCISILHSPGDDPNHYELASERWSPVQNVNSILLSVLSMLSGMCRHRASRLRQRTCPTDVINLTTQNPISSLAQTSTLACVNMRGLAHLAAVADTFLLKCNRAECVYGPHTLHRRSTGTTASSTRRPCGILFGNSSGCPLLPEPSASLNDWSFLHETCDVITSGHIYASRFAFCPLTLYECVTALRCLEEEPPRPTVHRLLSDSLLPVIDNRTERFEDWSLLLVQGEPVDRVRKDREASEGRHAELLCRRQINVSNGQGEEDSATGGSSAHHESFAVPCRVGTRGVLQQQADERRRLVLDCVRRVSDEKCERVDDVGSEIEFRQLEGAHQERQELWQFGDDGLLGHAL